MSRRKVLQNAADLLRGALVEAVEGSAVTRSSASLTVGPVQRVSVGWQDEVEKQGNPPGLGRPHGRGLVKHRLTGHEWERGRHGEMGSFWGWVFMMFPVEQPARLWRISLGCQHEATSIKQKGSTQWPSWKQ